MQFKKYFVVFVILTQLTDISKAFAVEQTTPQEDSETFTEQLMKAGIAAGVIGLVLRLGFSGNNSIVIFENTLNQELKRKGMKNPEKEDLMFKLQKLQEMNMASLSSENEVKDLEAIPVREQAPIQNNAPSSI